MSINFGQGRFGAVSLATVVYVHKRAESRYAPNNSSHSGPIAAGLDVGGSQKPLRYNASTSALFPHPVDACCTVSVSAARTAITDTGTTRFSVGSRRQRAVLPGLRL